MTPAEPKYEPIPGGRSDPQLAAWPTDDEASLADYVALLVDHRWLILACAVLALIVGGAWVWHATPLYSSDVLVQVEEKDQGLGIQAMPDMLPDKVPAETEMEIIRSRSLVGSVVDELALDVSAAPRVFPVIGGPLFRRHQGDALGTPLIGRGEYAWGGERIAVSRLAVPTRLLGFPLTLIAGSNGAYALRGPDGEPILDGKVGVVAEANGVSISVGELRARPGTEFVVARQRRSAVVAALQDQLRISEKGKKTGIIQVALEGDDPRRIAATLDAVARTYLRQNVERKSAEAEKTLEFLETQLPVLKANLEAAEGRLEAYKSNKGSVDVSLETQAMLARAVELEKALSELEVQRTELKHRFTDSHPALVMLEEKAQQLEREKTGIDVRFKKLPQAEMDAARLMRDAKVAQELYVALLNKAQELRVVKSGTIGNVRILDSAIVPIQPVSPKKAQILALSLVIGLVLGVALAFAKRALTRGVEDPEAIERETGLAIFASIPRSNRELRIDRAGETKVLAAADPSDPTVEAVRSLRTSVEFAIVDAKSRTITVLGSAPSVGKTFCSVNLAAVLAEAGKHVLLVDADLRKGRIHHFFGGKRDVGLSELVAGASTVSESIRRTSIPGLHVMTTGRIPPNPASLLGSERFSDILADLQRRYDHVVIDTSPVLAVTDGALVARHAGVKLLVLRAGVHPLREIGATLRALSQAGVRVDGAVLNDVQIRHGYGSYGYHYHYAYEARPKRGE